MSGQERRAHDGLIYVRVSDASSTPTKRCFRKKIVLSSVSEVKYAELLLQTRREKLRTVRGEGSEPNYV